MLHGIKINNFNTRNIEKCYLIDIGTIQVAKPRISESLEIYGANGTYNITDGAFEAYERTISFSVDGLDSVLLLINKFKDVDNVIVFEYHQDSIFYCDLLDVSYSPVGVKTWKVDFKLLFDPFRYINSSPIILTGNGSITNTGDIYSEPVIVIEGQGNVTLTIGKQLMQLTLDTKATIDCRHRKQNVYDKTGRIKNTIRKRGPFFEIQPGLNGIATSGTVTKITINGNWRYKV